MLSGGGPSIRSRLGGGALRGVMRDEAVHAGEKVFGEQRLEAKLDAKAFILLFGFGHAADDEDGEVRLEFAETGDELRTAHAGHDVVGEDEIDGFREVVVSQLVEGTLRAEDRDDKVACPLEDGLTSGGLHSVIVDEQDGRGHSYLAVKR